MEQGAMIGPIPRKLESPQQRDHLPEILGSCKDQVCIPEHLEKHDEEPNQKTVAERLAFHPLWDVLFPGEVKPTAQQTEYLSPAAVTVAVALCPPCDGDDQRDKEEKQADPGKQDVEKAQDQICQLHDP